ncbi:hypothetical protein I2I05_01260 [Hymenobacter sp. BT683]|uniref:Uncharacterized protein n=1 Tax=Hymenobacter jeongseonensis TaxID=2791027 RepID=A0ABS0ICD3_9BACT|nr:DUF5700 domain-containing putative Zn-dependent protease [Hymenobacter jeongseonensis]MBF9236012.1 hypothetical protein [Hymenobacter jeongseonensis]
MPLFFRPFLILLGLLLAAGPARAQTINVDAVTRYWEITEGLRQNRPLTDQMWQDFLEIPGNKIYVRGIYSAANLAAYRRAIEVVYMPRHDSLLQVKLKNKVWYYLMVNDYKEREAVYRNYVANVVRNPGSRDMMYQYAYEYLPARAHTKVPDLQIYYEALGNDATSQAEGLFYSLRAVLDANEVKPGLLEGHEMHHQLRPGKDFGTIAAEDEGLIGILASMQNEGIADLIDKPLTMGMPGDPRGIREWAMAPAPGFINKMDSAIQARARGGAPATGRYYRQLSNGSNGHLPGFFMSSVIEKNGYKKQLLTTCDDPFAFVTLYQKAAKKDKSHPPLFSVASITYLNQLARKYAKPRPAPASASAAP